MNILDTMTQRVLEQKRKVPLTYEKAREIALKQSTKSGYLNNAGTLTKKWINRWELTKWQRAKSRLSTQTWKPTNQYLYYNWKVRLKNMYK